MSRNLVVTIAVVLLLVVGGWFLMRPSQQATAPMTQETPTTTPTASSEATSAASMGEIKEVTISGAEFAFTPKTLSVKMGEKVKLTFKNDGKYPHDLKIDELGVATKVIGVGQSEVVEFTASKSGTFAMYCSVGNHRKQGMEGTVSIQ